MKELLEAYLELTKKQIDLLGKGEIDASLDVVAEKDLLFLEIKKGVDIGGPRQAYPDLVEEIQRLNSQAVLLLSRECSRLQGEMAKFQVGRQAQETYSSTYQSDAYFFDKKK